MINAAERRQLVTEQVLNKYLFVQHSEILKWTMWTERGPVWRKNGKVLQNLRDLRTVTISSGLHRSSREDVCSFYPYNSHWA